MMYASLFRDFVEQFLRQVGADPMEQSCGTVGCDDDTGNLANKCEGAGREGKTLAGVRGLLRGREIRGNAEGR